MRSLKYFLFFFFSSRRRHTRLQGDWSSDVCSSDLSPRRLARLSKVAREHGVDLLADFFGDLDFQRAKVRLQLLKPRSAGDRSEERRVGKEWRMRGGSEQ